MSSIPSYSHQNSKHRPLLDSIYANQMMAVVHHHHHQLYLSRGSKNKSTQVAWLAVFAHWLVGAEQQKTANWDNSSSFESLPFCLGLGKVIRWFVNSQIMTRDIEGPFLLQLDALPARVWFVCFRGWHVYRKCCFSHPHPLSFASLGGQLANRESPWQGPIAYTLLQFTPIMTAHQLHWRMSGQASNVLSQPHQICLSDCPMTEWGSVM